MDARTHSLMTRIREMTLGVREGSSQMADLRQSLVAELRSIAPHIPRREALDLEVLIERLTGAKQRERD